MLNEIMKARLKKDAKSIARKIASTPLEHRGVLFAEIGNQMDMKGEVPLCSLFIKIAMTYQKKEKAG